MNLPPELLQRAKRIRALVLDVDGVLTDGRLIYTEAGDELKSFDVQDGTGLVFWHRAGYRSAIITGKQTAMVRRRVKDLGVGFLAQKALDKLTPYERFRQATGLDHAQICAMGDDVLDLPVLRRAGLSVAVLNAVAEVHAACHVSTSRPGGSGAVREVVEAILKAQDAWEPIVKAYLI
jgi:3-deoxy-D-manno-octulosonate 8-phosphate phosphatase (KDO 8-P phosphatase)